MVTSVTSTTVTLQWMPPDTTNCLITHYSVQYDETMINNFGTKTLNGWTGIVKGLSPDTEYKVNLKAHTRVGQGPPASLSVKTGMLLILKHSKVACYLHCHTAEFKIKKTKYLDMWPNTSVTIWPFRKVLGHPQVSMLSSNY